MNNEPLFEIKTVKIGRQQLKPGLLKQIPLEHIIDRSGKLSGTALVRLEYHIGCEWLGALRKKPNTHIHILWLKNGELRHAIEPLGSNTRGVAPWSTLERLDLVYVI